MLRLMRKALCRDAKTKNGKEKKRSRSGMSVTNLVYESYLEDSQDGRQSMTSQDNNVINTPSIEIDDSQIYDEIIDKDDNDTETNDITKRNDVTEAKEEMNSSENEEISSGDENDKMYNHLTTFKKRMKFTHYDTLLRDNKFATNIWRTQSAMEIRHNNNNIPKFLLPEVRVNNACADVTNNNDVTRRYLNNTNILYTRGSRPQHLSNPVDRALCTYRRPKKTKNTENRVSQLIATLETRSKQSSSVQSLNNIPRRINRDSAVQRRNASPGKVHSFMHEKPIVRSSTLSRHSHSRDGGREPNNELFDSFLFNTMKKRMSSVS